MSEHRDATPSEPPPAEAAIEPKPEKRRRGGWIVAGVAAALAIAALIGTAPYWSPLLAWGPSEALDARIERIEAALQAQDKARQELQRQIQEQAATKASLQQLEQRLAAVEKRPGASADELADLRQRLDRLAAQPSAASTEIAELRQQLTKLAATTGELSARVDRLDTAAHQQSTADKTDLAQVLSVLEMRDAILAGRPFASQYETLAALTRSQPALAEAAAPLAEAARSGVAGRGVLSRRLRDLAGTITDASADAAEGGWFDQTLNRLRGLVTIRRVDGTGTAGPTAPVDAAEAALANGDLAGAIAALDRLSGASAQAARPWLQMARQRLAAEQALERLDTLLLARLSGTEPASTTPKPGG